MRLGQLRGDVIAGLAYVSNWYQIWVGQGYTASGDFAPLRHLWSLAVEEQFYLLWPLVMIVILRLGARRVPNVELWPGRRGRGHRRRRRRCSYHPGPIATCELTPEAYWQRRRSVHLEDRLPLPVDADARRRSAARRGAGHGVAPGGADARADAPARPAARRRRRGRVRRARRAAAGTSTSSPPTAPTRGCSGAAS